MQLIQIDHWGQCLYISGKIRLIVKFLFPHNPLAENTQKMLLDHLANWLKFMKICIICICNNCSSMESLLPYVTLQELATGGDIFIEGAWILIIATCGYISYCFHKTYKPSFQKCISYCVLQTLSITTLYVTVNWYLHITFFFG